MRDELAAARARAGTEIEDVIGGADRLLVVLDDDDGIAEIAQPTQRAEQPLVVALMQADARLVEHVENAGQPAPICVASRMRCASPPESVPLSRSSVR